RRTSWRGRGRARDQIRVATINEAGATYSLEVEREGERSDDDHQLGRDDIQAGGGKGGREVRSRMRPSTRQGRRTGWRWRGRARGQITDATVEEAGTTYQLEVEREARGQITDATVNEAGTTYFLEVEREGERSDHGCDHQRGRDDVQAGGGGEGREVRSQMRPSTRQGQRGGGRWGGRARGQIKGGKTKGPGQT